MESAARKNARISSGENRMSSVAIRTLTINEAIAAALRPWSVGAIAERVKTSKRTVENWKLAKTGPQVKHIAAMLNDDELCDAMLEAFGRADLAGRARMTAILKEARGAIDDALAASEEQ